MNVEDAVRYLKEQDLNGMPVGRYKVNDDFYFMIQEYETKEHSLCKTETHRVFTDIQWILEGSEIIEVHPLDDTLKEKVPYDAVKDVAFWENPADAEKLKLGAGDYRIFSPDIAHRPGMRTGDKPEKVRKCVGKVK